jgi:nucleoside 2-deoxyribosyltransferase
MKLYLAGPDVFRPDAARWAGQRARCAAAAGHLALIPWTEAATARGDLPQATCA